MQRPALLAAGIGTGLVLALGGIAVSQASHQAPAAAPGVVAQPAPTGTRRSSPATTGGGGEDSNDDDGAGSGATSSSGVGATASGSGQTATAVPGRTVVVNGTAASTQYGTVQVQITLSKHHITAVQALALPAGGRSSRISAAAAPALRQETLTAQSANIDTVSGASYTSEGWRTSLQGALDIARAHGY